MSDNSEKQSRCKHCVYCSTPDHVNAHGDLQGVSRKLKLRHKEACKSHQVSLKSFVKGLLKSGDAMAQTWQEHKKGMLNESRSETNRIRVRDEKSASKLARKKSKAGGSKPTETK